MTATDFVTTYFGALFLLLMVMIFAMVALIVYHMVTNSIHTRRSFNTRVNRRIYSDVNKKERKS